MSVSHTRTTTAEQRHRGVRLTFERRALVVGLVASMAFGRSGSDLVLLVGEVGGGEAFDGHPELCAFAQPP